MNRKILMRVTSLATAALFGCAFAITSTFGGNVITARANGLTQTADASKVSYGTTSESDIALLKQIFDLNYYRKNNPELEALFGDNYNAWFEHFYRYGIYEGRTCSENFDPSAYASAYSDLKAAFGSNILEYYKFYLTEGKDDPNRQITTLKQCADNGITVQALTDSEVRITPQLYAVAEKFGTQDFKAVSTVVQRAIVEAAAVGGTAVISNGEESVVITDDGSSASNTSDQKAETPASSDSAASGSSEETKPSSDSDVSGSSEETSGGSSESSETPTGGNESGAAGIIDKYTVVKTISLVSDGFNIAIYKGNTSGYGAWSYTYTDGEFDNETGTFSSTSEYVLKAKTADYDYKGATTVSETNEAMGTRVAYIPEYVYDAHTTDAEKFSDGTPRFDTEIDQYMNPGVTAEKPILSGSAEKVSGTLLSGEGDYASEYPYSIVIDSNGNTNTSYEVGVSFGDTSDENKVEVSVAIVSEDESFAIENNYTIDTEAATSQSGDSFIVYDPADSSFPEG